MSGRFEKLDDDFLMSRLFTAAEVEVSRLALTELSGTDLDVVGGGLGLGFTALTVPADPRVRSMAVVEALGPVNHRFPAAYRQGRAASIHSGVKRWTQRYKVT